MSLDILARATDGDTFRHEAFMYDGIGEFVDGAVAFIRGGLAAGEPVLVVVSEEKIEQLSDELGPDAGSVAFADMAAVGRNPNCIIAAWHEFVREHAGNGARLRGIGEPIGPDRRPAELAECHRHESLLNVAFAGAPAWWLLCPYDTRVLAADVVDEARRTHPFVCERGEAKRSVEFRPLDVRRPWDRPLPPPPAHAVTVAFDAGTLRGVREIVTAWADGLGLGAERTADLVVAVNEVATNSLRHGGGRGTLVMWHDDETLVCDVCDRGWISEPLVGRRPPALERRSGRGLWLANQLCDLVQLRSTADGTTVRMHVRRG